MQFSGDRLRELRENRTIDRQELAQRAGLSEFTIRSLELGVRAHPGVETASALAEALGVPIADLMQADDPDGDGA